MRPDLFPVVDALRAEEGGKAFGLGLLGGEGSERKAMIRDNIPSTYICSMTCNDDFDVIQFNIILEMRRPAAKPLGLKYRPDLEQLHLVTLY